MTYVLIYLLITITCATLNTYIQMRRDPLWGTPDTALLVAVWFFWPLTLPVVIFIIIVHYVSNWMIKDSYND